MRPIGFSTGSLALGDFRLALEQLQGSGTDAIELSALRFNELVPLVQCLDELELGSYSHISVHAPGRYPAQDEKWLVDQLSKAAARGWPVVLHPDAIHDFRSWLPMGGNVLIENMDKRKPIGRTASELDIIFKKLPEAGMCFDIAHARQFDSSMTEAYAILKRHGHRIRQLHISEVSTASSHARISKAAIADFREVAWAIPADVPVILETPVSPDQYQAELDAACEALFMPSLGQLHTP
jgi:hypothetical protein